MAKKTEIRTHRGSQIGGCITEISTGTTRILIDFGQELPGSRNETPFSFPWDRRPVDAVLFTHYHGDHIGRFAQVPDGVRLYMGGLSQQVLCNIHGALEASCAKRAELEREEDQAAKLRAECLEHRRAQEILTGERVRLFQPKPGEDRMMERVALGDITVTPCRVDHSASDAFMFLIETPDRVILHTGDFRGHGSQGEHGAAVLADVKRFQARPRTIDTLIIEGTMMSRRNEPPYSEADLQKSAQALFQAHRHVFLLVSSTNLDSIRSFCLAAKERGIPLYCHNAYTAAQLSTLGRYAREVLGLEGLEDAEQIDNSPEQRARMRENGFVVLINAYCKGLIGRFRGCNPAVVYSMWPGYIRRGLNPALCQFHQWCQDRQIPFYPPMDGSPSPFGPLHTSGHAEPKLILDVIEAAIPVEPGVRKELRPIHTEDVGAFYEMQELSEEMKRQITVNGYRRETDCRSLGGAALEKFKEGKPWHKFVQLVNRHPETLAFCLRGNSQNSAILYYKNHAMFHITATGALRFNFDHARYMPDWRAQADRLHDCYGYEFRQPAPVLQKSTWSMGSAVMPCQRAQALSEPDLKQLCTDLRTILYSFFEAGKSGAIDQFWAHAMAAQGRTKEQIQALAKEENRIANRELTEKEVQQQLFRALGTAENGYFFGADEAKWYLCYDMEFSQPHADDLGCKNQPDLMAVRFGADGTPERLVLVEVKSRPEALRGSSGVRAHVRGMEHYPDWLLRVRGADAYDMLDQYAQLGLRPDLVRAFRREDFEGLPREILLIFTGAETIAALDTPDERDGGETIRLFLQRRGYEEASGARPPISIGGGQLEPVAAWRREFGGLSLRHAFSPSNICLK